MENPTETHVGALLRYWRKVRNASQFDLAMRAGTSQRHLSFMESGWARPSREMVLQLAETLDVPLRGRNEMLIAAGYAPFYQESVLTANEFAGVRGMLDRILTHHEPYPAMVLDGGWNILMYNMAAGRILGPCFSSGPGGTCPREVNFLKLMCDPEGMKPHIVSWAQTGPALLSRLRREASANPGSRSAELLRELLDKDAFPTFNEPRDATTEVAIPVELMIDDTRLRLVNMVTTFGTPQDVTLQELRIEMSFPADDASDSVLRQWAEDAAGPEVSRGASS